MARSRPRGSADPAPAAARSATAGSRARAGSTPARTRSNAPTRITGEARSAGSAPAARNLADRADRSAPDLLARYRAKRDFSKTPEPAPRAPAPRDTGLAFTIQRHDARRLHYDFRLEWDGVLKSWAVPKGPSLDPAQKRLAVQTEDHPLDYGTFEGAIPAGEYGGGDVLLWDHGHWRPLHDATDGLAKGKLHFELSGHKLQGEWVLVRLPAR
ncbi:MAG: ATP-dependent DNA ligase, partial [Burkholderiaceae bacterium]|nr:ATP-dependent DNA ligase [Burkholderiaceae bacterium]